MTEYSEDNPKKVEFEDVNKFEHDWDPPSLFSNFNVRAILSKRDDIITQMTETSRMRKKLTRRIGNEGDDWYIVENVLTGSDELYLKDSGILVMWKLDDHNGFKELFDRIEQHQEELNGIQQNPKYE